MSERATSVQINDLTLDQLLSLRAEEMKLDDIDRAAQRMRTLSEVHFQYGAQLENARLVLLLRRDKAWDII